MTSINMPAAAWQVTNPVDIRARLEALARQHAAFVYAAAMRQVRDPHLAADVAQLGADLPGPTQLALKAGSHEVRQALGTELGEIRQAAKAEDPRHQAKPAPANDLP